MQDAEPGSRFPADLPAWLALQSHYDKDMHSQSIAALFADDANRFDQFSIGAADLFLDYSKNLISAKTRELLLDLAGEAGVGQGIEAMFRGDAINNTEGRPVLHVALRAAAEDQVGTGVAGVADVQSTLAAMAAFVDGVHAGEITGVSGQSFTDVVNIGIGGSDLGPVMASRALRHCWKPGMRFHSVSNVDGTQWIDLTSALDAEKTLIIICSKTFTTQETMSNAALAREWMKSQLGDNAIDQHFAAASTNHAAMDKFGINPDYRFGFWDWVGGRYSLWSAVGLSLALVIGMDGFRELLRGAREMDRHFRTAPFEQNLPVLLALIAIWYNNFFGAESQVILPYDNRLDRFAAYLQQLQMESNGKSVRRDGQPVAVQTGAVIWGEPGSNAQHSFYQLLHQGTRLVPADFILPVQSSGATQSLQDLAISNCLAQSEALMDGYAAESEDEAYRTHPGNRPSNTILLEKLDPGTLGQLLALYEHKVFVEGVIWGINSFDQYGVELGKRLAKSLTDAVSGDSGAVASNASTRGLLGKIHGMKKRLNVALRH